MQTINETPIVENNGHIPDVDVSLSQPFPICSKRIAELMTALHSAKLEFEPILKSAENPHFKNKYATLDNIFTAIQPALLKFGLQLSTVSVQKEGGRYYWRTVLVHEQTQQFIGTEFPYEPDLKSPQKTASSQTYAQRYNVASLLALVIEDDDDGNVASSGNKMVQRLSEKQATALRGLLKQYDCPQDDVKTWLTENGYTKLDDVDSAKHEEVSHFIRVTILKHLHTKLKLDINEDVKPLLQSYGCKRFENLPSDKFKEVVEKFNELHTKRYADKN